MPAYPPVTSSRIAPKPVLLLMVYTLLMGLSLGVWLTVLFYLTIWTGHFGYVVFTTPLLLTFLIFALLASRQNARIAGAFD